MRPEREPLEVEPERANPQCSSRARGARSHPVSRIGTIRELGVSPSGVAHYAFAMPTMPRILAAAPIRTRRPLGCPHPPGGADVAKEILAGVGLLAAERCENLSGCPGPVAVVPT